MASYVKLLRSIWQDDDFRALPASSQRLYLLLLSQPDVSVCGVLPLTPGRWARLATDTDADSVHVDICRLVADDFIFVDAETEEIWIRTYIKHDRGFNTPNIVKALLRSLESILSVPIRHLVGSVLETVGVTVPQTVWLSQQPAASSLQPVTSSQQPAESRNRSDAPSVLTNMAAAAAVDLFVDHETRSKHPRNARTYAASIRSRVIDEFGTALAITTDPDRESIAVRVLGMSASDASTAAWWVDQS